MSVPLREWYERVNAAWMGPLPVLTEAEARTAAKRLWRWGTGSVLPYKIEFTSGRRYTWERRGKLYINAGKGWCAFVHDLSHLEWARTNPGTARAHEKGHAKLELRMRREVFKRGWLGGSLKRGMLEGEAAEAAVYNAVHAQLSRLDAALAARKVQAQKREKWARARLDIAEHKLSLLQKRVAKLRRQVSYYDRKARTP